MIWRHLLPPGNKVALTALDLWRLLKLPQTQQENQGAAPGKQLDLVCHSASAGKDTTVRRGNAGEQLLLTAECVSALSTISDMLLWNANIYCIFKLWVHYIGAEIICWLINQQNMYWQLFLINHLSQKYRTFIYLWDRYNVHRQTENSLIVHIFCVHLFYVTVNW